MPSKKYSTVLPPKLERRLRSLIYYHADGLISDAIKKELFGDNERLFEAYHYMCNFRRIARDSKTPEEQEELSDVWRTYTQKTDRIAKQAIEEGNKTDKAFFDHVEQRIYDDIVSFFSSLTVNEEQTLTPRKRRERVRDIQSGTAEAFKAIPLHEYLLHFIRYLCNAPPDTSWGSWQDAAWPREDWDSDAIMIVRGHMISKSLRSGKGVHLDAPNVEDVKTQAAKFIPKEGDVYTRVALSMIEGLNQDDLPEVWRVNEEDHRSVVMHPELLESDGQPLIEILHVDDDYILMQIDNLAAAQAFGSRDWCITYGHWDEYCDNFLMICDANDGERYGIHFGSGHFVDTADQHVGVQAIMDKYSKVSLDATDMEDHEITDYYRRMMERYDGVEPNFIRVFTKALKEDLEGSSLNEWYDGNGFDLYERNKKKFIEIFSERFSGVCREASPATIRSFLEAVLEIDIDDTRTSLLMALQKQDIAKAVSILDAADEELPSRIIATYSGIHIYGDNDDIISGLGYLKEAGIVTLNTNVISGKTLPARTFGL